MDTIEIRDLARKKPQISDDENNIKSK